MDAFKTFVAGPVEMSAETLGIGGSPLPYFRTADFSALMLAAERDALQLFDAPEGSRAVFLTGSGTAAMEAVVSGLFTESDNLIVINGGSFGQRFSDICAFHGIPHGDIRLSMGEALTAAHLDARGARGHTGLLVNLHETSTGVLYDIDLIARFCRENGLMLVVDAISAFIADPFSMEEHGIDAAITSSQKALAAAPGISIAALGLRALSRVKHITPKSYYLDLRRALMDGERGQTPFTSAVSVLMQLFPRLRELSGGGMERERAHMRALSEDFRRGIRPYPFVIPAQSLSNAVTPLSPTSGASAHGIFETLMRDYRIYVSPNGGELRDRLFRVGHMGALTLSDNARLIAAIDDMKRRGLI